MGTHETRQLGSPNANKLDMYQYVCIGRVCMYVPQSVRLDAMQHRRTNDTENSLCFP